MAAEDAAVVLEQFVQDVANLPAEIAHLLEEIQAKDRTIQECRSTINARDNSIQKFVRLNGSLTPNPKEEVYSKTVLQNYDRAQVLQEEKVGLSEKASTLLDRQIRRLDVKIRELQNEGALVADPPLPSLLHPSSTGRASISSTPITGASTPLNPVSNNILPSTTLANSSITRLTHPQPPNQRTGSPSTAVAALNPLVGILAHQAASSAPTSPGTSMTAGQGRQRESSAGASDTKRRRLLNSHHLGSIPTQSSNLARQSSLGPGTPKAGTPTGGARSGSAGPRMTLKKATNKKLAPHQQSAAARSRKTTATSKAGALHRKATKKHLTGDGHHDESAHSEAGTGSPRSTGSGSGGEDDEDDDVPLTPGQLAGSSNSLSRRLGVAAAAAQRQDEDELMEDDDDGGDGDDRKYCTCRNVSHGNMVACDNDDCPYEWFHWGCVGMTKEPVGKWYCPECRTKMGGGVGGGQVVAAVGAG